MPLLFFYAQDNLIFKNQEKLRGSQLVAQQIRISKI